MGKTVCIGLSKLYQQLNQQSQWVERKSFVQCAPAVGDFDSQEQDKRIYCHCQRLLAHWNWPDCEKPLVNVVEVTAGGVMDDSNFPASNISIVYKHRLVTSSMNINNLLPLRYQTLHYFGDKQTWHIETKFLVDFRICLQLSTFFRNHKILNNIFISFFNNQTYVFFMHFSTEHGHSKDQVRVKVQNIVITKYRSNTLKSRQVLKSLQFYMQYRPSLESF